MKISALLHPALRKALVRRLGELVILVALIAGAWYAQGWAIEQRLEYLSAQKEREQRPQTEALLGEIEAQLAEQTRGLDRVNATIPTRDNIGEYISFLEGRATKHRVELEITNVAEEIEPEQGAEPPPVPVADGYGVVRLKLVAKGTTSALLEFLHDVEHGQYVSAVPEWELRAATLRGRGTAVPPGIGTPPGSASQEVSSENQLAAEIILITENNGSEGEA